MARTGAHPHWFFEADEERFQRLRSDLVDKFYELDVVCWGWTPSISAGYVTFTENWTLEMVNEFFPEFHWTLPNEPTVFDEDTDEIDTESEDEQKQEEE